MMAGAYPPGLLDPMAGDGRTLSSYNPSLREKTTDWLRGLLYTDDREGQDKAEYLNRVAETMIPPYGMAAGVNDATNSTARGDYGAAALQAMALIPGAHLKHGSPLNGIAEIKPSTRGPLGPGVYTTPSEHVARRYAGGEGTVYSLPETHIDVFTGAGHRDVGYEAYLSDVKRLKSAAHNSLPVEKAKEVEAIIDKMWSGDGYPLYQRIRIALGGDEPAQNLFKEAGFQGLSGQIDGPETLLFGPQKTGNK